MKNFPPVYKFVCHYISNKKHTPINRECAHEFINKRRNTPNFLILQVCCITIVLRYIEDITGYSANTLTLTS